MISDREYLDHVSSGFFANINKQFGRNTCLTLKVWMSSAEKYKNIESHIEFLIKCRRHDVYPKHLEDISNNLKHFTFKTNFLNDKTKSKIEQLKKDLLNIEIRDAHFQRKSLKRELIEIEEQLEQQLPVEILNNFYKVQNQTLTALSYKLYDTKNNKFDKIMETNRIKYFD